MRKNPVSTETSIKTDRAKVNAWLDRINETDEACRAEVLERCAKDPEARAYYVMRSEEEF